MAFGGSILRLGFAFGGVFANKHESGRVAMNQLWQST
jgi:hypothetical protein